MPFCSMGCIKLAKFTGLLPGLIAEGIANVLFNVFPDALHGGYNKTHLQARCTNAIANVPFNMLCKCYCKCE